MSTSARGGIIGSVASEYRCPHCGETVDTWPDPGGGEVQDYVEDCAVCCRPNRIHASYQVDEDAYVVEADPE